VQGNSGHVWQSRQHQPYSGEVLIQNTKCAACKGAHKAADWKCPKYLELLRQIDPVDCHA
jgi:C4-type Zn-finger protein